MCVGEPSSRLPAALAAAGGLLAAVTCYAAPAGAQPADTTGNLDEAIAAVRAASACAALHQDPVAQRAAEISNRSTEDYLNHAAQYVPVSDPLAVLTDLGSDTTRAVQLQGYGRSDADAIKGAVLQGNSAIPDCGYTRLGTSVLHNPQRGYTIVVAVLAGP